jgi:hypothetical protein
VILGSKYIMACCLKVGIPESERPSIAKQRLGNQVSCLCDKLKHVHTTTHT